MKFYSRLRSRYGACTLNYYTVQAGMVALIIFSIYMATR